MAEYGNNYDYGDSPFYKDEGVEASTEVFLNLTTPGDEVDLIILPFQEAPSFLEEVTVDGVPLRLRFHWSTYGEYWSLDIYDVYDDPIVCGIRLVIGLNLLSGYYADARLPSGRLFVIDPTESMLPIGYDDFMNERALKFLYVPRST